jgi:hypothetical protein
MFILYKHLTKDEEFDYDKEDKVKILDNFLKSVDKSFELLDKNIKYITDARLCEDKWIKKIESKFSKNPLIFIIIYVYHNYDKENFEINLRKILIYNMVLNILPKNLKNESAEKHRTFKQKDVIGYESGGGFAKRKVVQITENKIEIPDSNIIQNLLEFTNNILVDPVEKSKSTRKAYQKFYILCMILYFNSSIPKAHLDKEKEVDHIIPFSSKWDSKLDINRLGNLMIINKDINRTKRDNMLTDEYIRENKLDYYNYPSEECQVKILKDKAIINNEEYENMCKIRETRFFEKIIEFS